MNREPSHRSPHPEGSFGGGDTRVPASGERKSRFGIRWQNPAQSVGTKLLLIYFVSIVSVVLAIGILSYQVSKNIIENKVAESSHQTIAQATDKVSFLLESVETTSVQLLADEQFAESLTRYKNPELTQFDRLQLGQQISTRLKSFVLSNNKLADIQLIPATSGATTSYHSDVSDSVFQTGWFQQIVEGDGRAVWLPASKNGYLGASDTFALGRVLRNIRSGSTEGILIIEVKVSALKEALGVLSIGNGSDIAIVSQNNRVVYAEQNNLIETTYSLDIAGHAAKGDKASFKESLVGSNGSSEEVLAVYSPIERADWLLAGVIPVSELVKDASLIFVITLVMVAVSALLAIGVGVTVVRMIARPLVNLRNLMTEGARGNLTVRMNQTSRRDEIGQLADSFNQMMEQITSLVAQTNDSAKEVLRTASELSDSSRQTALSANEIAVATEEIAKGASSLAAEAERGSDLTATISHRVDHVVESNTTMEAAASDVQAASAKGAEYMTALLTKTSTAENMIRAMGDKVIKLQESTGSIRNILTLLDNIAKQTNILSLNATIEAARAGAAGKGFMVVANEVRQLADQSKESIRIVADITERIQTEMEETICALSQAYPIFQEQLASARDTDAIFRQVQLQMEGFTDKLQETTDSIRQLKESQATLLEAMSNVSAVAEESSATSQEVASLSSEQLSISGGLVKLSERLENLSGSLKGALGKFSI